MIMQWHTVEPRYIEPQGTAEMCSIYPMFDIADI
jgi:hypothetical protein